jgi:hypothetical protein
MRFNAARLDLTQSRLDDILGRLVVMDEQMRAAAREFKRNRLTDAVR